MSLPAVVHNENAAVLEQVVINGDLSKLSPADRVRYYRAVCDSLGLNPLTKPFDYIQLNGKLTLYAKKDCADQLRRNRGITITKVEPQRVDDLYVVVAYGVDKDGRQDSATGAVTIAGLKGEALANALMKAETKAKRRLTLSLAGLGWTDEAEVDSIPDARRVAVNEDGVIEQTEPVVAQPMQSQTTAATDWKQEWSLVLSTAVANGWKEDDVKAAAKAMGYKKPSEITPADFDRLLEQFGTLAPDAGEEAQSA